MISRLEIRNLISSLMGAIEGRNPDKDNPFWKNNTTLDDILSGTAELLTNSSTTWPEIENMIPKVADIDIFVDKSNWKNLYSVLASFENVNIGTDIIFLSTKKIHPIATTKEFNILVSTKDGIRFQVNFKLVAFENGIPTQFERFMRSERYDDLKMGVKSVAKRVMVRALVHNIKMVKGKVFSKSATIDAPMFKNSIGGEFPIFELNMSGVRKKYEPVIGVDGLQFRHIMKSVYSEIEIKDSVIESNIESIFSLIFAKNPTQKELEMFDSFNGIVFLLKKYKTEKEQSDIVARYNVVMSGFNLNSDELDAANSILTK